MHATEPVGGLIGQPVATIRPTATLREAAEALMTDDIGLLVVVDPSGVRGVLSERDILAAVAEGLDLDDERVRDSATHDVLTVDETATIRHAARTMTDARIRHLAVSRNGVTTGVVSIRDVVDALLEQGTAATTA